MREVKVGTKHTDRAFGHNTTLTCQWDIWQSENWFVIAQTFGVMSYSSTGTFTHVFLTDTQSRFTQCLGEPHQQTVSINNVACLAQTNVQHLSGRGQYALSNWAWGKHGAPPVPMPNRSSVQQSIGVHAHVHCAHAHPHAHACMVCVRYVYLSWCVRDAQERREEDKEAHQEARHPTPYVEVGGNPFLLQAVEPV